MNPNKARKITSKEIAILDNNSEWLGIPKNHLMECAGYSAALEIYDRYLKEANLDQKIAIFCGTGNNGGDGFVIARHLSSFGYKVLVILVGAPEKISTHEARLNWDIISQSLRHSINIQIIKDSTDLSKIGMIIEEDGKFEILIDSLLGTGVKGKIREPIATAIDLINAMKEEEPKKMKVISIDVPSGMHPDTGEVLDKAVKADLVATFHAMKEGMEESNDYIKEIAIKSIGIPPEASLYVGKGDFISTLKKRKIDTHKGEFGRILIIGGSKNYSGAPSYSSLASINFGMDLVITYTPQVVGDVIRSYSPNLIVRTHPGDWLNINSLDEIAWLVEWSNAILIGPGMGTEKETENLLVELLKKMNQENKSYVLDADALKLVKEHLSLIKKQNAILTPHEGELAIMTGIDLPAYDNLMERCEIIKNLAKELKATLLVKGVYDIISNGKELKINRTGCPEMSIGGTGDILAGLCTCFLTTENTPFQSACSAAFFNGYLGEFTKKNYNSRFTSMDMIKSIPKALKDLMEMKDYMNYF